MDQPQTSPKNYEQDNQEDHQARENQSAQVTSHSAEVREAQVQQQIAQAQSQSQQSAEPEPIPELKEIKPISPSFFGYKPPKWAHDFDYVRNRKGKGSPSDVETWSLYLVDRLLKKHSV